MNLLGFFCIFLVFLECFERESTVQVGACVLPYHIFFHTAASKMVWPWWLADSRTHVKCAFVCALRCEWVCGCSVSIFYFSISLFVTMNGKDQTLRLHVWTDWHRVRCFCFAFLSFLFSSMSLWYHQTCKHFFFTLNLVKTDVLPRLIGFMYCMTKACAQRHTISPSQNQHLLLGNTYSCSNL